jgi:hypothetical protein
MADTPQDGRGGNRRSPALSFAPYHELAGRPNVVVDGSPAEGTVLCLSHWPGIEAPEALRADLSAEMAFRYLRSFDLHDPATLVSNNHFDQDGLVSLYALASPAEALPRERLLVDVARAGDFAIYEDRRAARASMVVAAYATPERSPITDLPGDYAEATAVLYEEMLARLPGLCDDPGPYRELWAEEDESLSASEALLAGGGATIDEVPDVDLAVVTVEGDGPRAGGHRFGSMWELGLHPMAICGATERGAVLVIRGRSYELTYRYESWVQYQTKRPRPRVDLGDLVERLNAEESGGGRWVADPVSALTPKLRLDGAEGSSIAPVEFRSLLESHLRTASPTWNPYRPRPKPAE